MPTLVEDYNHRRISMKITWNAIFELINKSASESRRILKQSHANNIAKAHNCSAMSNDKIISLVE